MVSIWFDCRNNYHGGLVSKESFLPTKRLYIHLSIGAHEIHCNEIEEQNISKQSYCCLEFKVNPKFSSVFSPFFFRLSIRFVYGYSLLSPLVEREIAAFVSDSRFLILARLPLVSR